MMRRPRGRGEPGMDDGFPARRRESPAAVRSWPLPWVVVNFRPPLARYGQLAVLTYATRPLFLDNRLAIRS
jgi:hypothetical protein